MAGGAVCSSPSPDGGLADEREPVARREISGADCLSVEVFVACRCLSPVYGYASTSESWNMYQPCSRFRSLVALIRILSVV